MARHKIDRRRSAARLLANGNQSDLHIDRRSATGLDVGLASPFDLFLPGYADRRTRVPGAFARDRGGRREAPAAKRSIFLRIFTIGKIDALVGSIVISLNRAYSAGKSAVLAALDRVFQERPKQIALLCGTLAVVLFLAYGAFIDIIDPLKYGRIVAAEGHAFISTFRPDGTEWYSHVELGDNGGYQYRGSMEGRQDRTLPLAISLSGI